MAHLTRNKDPQIKEGPDCIICGAKTFQPLYSYTYAIQNSQAEAEILKCHGCGHLFIYPVPLEDLESRSMKSITDAEFYNNNLFKFFHEKIIINREIHNVKKLLNSSAPRLLDIGCGTGWTTAIWEKNGFVPTGLEPSPERSKLCQEKYNIPVSNEYIENFESEEKFDIVIMRHLLEHVESPKIVLKKIRDFLKEDGILLIIVPNINCIGRYLFNENWQWKPNWHVHFFTPETLSKLLSSAGFQNKKMYQMPSPLWYPKSFIRAIGEKSVIGSFLTRLSAPIQLIPFLPLMFLGLILGLNDNLTVISHKGS